VGLVRQHHRQLLHVILKVIGFGGKAIVSCKLHDTRSTNAFIFPYTAVGCSTRHTMTDHIDDPKYDTASEEVEKELDRGGDGPSYLSSGSSSAVSAELSDNASFDDSIGDEDDLDDDNNIRSSLTLLERQSRNVERNNRFLESLNEKYKDRLPRPSLKRVRPSQNNEEGNDFGENKVDTAHEGGQHPLSTGILMRDSYRLFCSRKREMRRKSYVELVQQVVKRYPHREFQIHQLFSLLDSNVSVQFLRQRQVHVPAPIFCIGPASTGKTSIICDVVETLKEKQNALNSDTVTEHKHEQSSLRVAYIDCSVLEPSSIERLVALVYQQLQPIEAAGYRPRRKSRLVVTQPLEKNVPTTEQSEGTSNQEGIGSKVESTLARENLHHPNSYQPDNKAGTSRRILPSRSAKVVNEKISSARNMDSVGRINSYVHPSAGQQREKEKVETSNSVVVSLGRSLQQSYGNSAISVRSGILILDRAEELLSLSSADKKSDRRQKEKNLSISNRTSTSTTKNSTNFLSELLLLPKIMRLNLTVVVVTNYATLDKTSKI
jgi:hypothetical protein